MGRNVKRRSVRSFFVGAVAGAMIVAGGAAAHDINSPNVEVAGSPYCVKLNSEIDHNDSNGLRTWSELQNKKNGTPYTCNINDFNYSRIKRALYSREIGGTAYALCRIGTGDGEGSPNYYHKSDPIWGVNGPWYPTAPCGWKDYITRSWGDEQNNGWHGSGASSIPSSTFHQFK